MSAPDIVEGKEIFGSELRHVPVTKVCRLPFLCINLHRSNGKTRYGQRLHWEIVRYDGKNSPVSKEAEDNPNNTADTSPTKKLSAILQQSQVASREAAGRSNTQEGQGVQTIEDIAAHLRRFKAGGAASPNRYDRFLDPSTNLPVASVQPPHGFYVYATKHNTHITLTRPSRDPILSVAAGNIGFKKAARGSYDAAYQLAAYVMGRIQEQGLMAQIHQLEVVLRGFGAGREAVTKALLGSEGRNIRGRVVRVTDATRLKFGGTRSPKPRRLG